MTSCLPSRKQGYPTWISEEGATHTGHEVTEYSQMHRAFFLINYWQINFVCLHRLLPFTFSLVANTLLASCRRCVQIAVKSAQPALDSNPLPTSIAVILVDCIPSRLHPPIFVRVQGTSRFILKSQATAHFSPINIPPSLPHFLLLSLSLSLICRHQQVKIITTLV